MHKATTTPDPQEPPMRTWTATQTRQLPAFAAALPMAPAVPAAHPHSMPAMRTAGRWKG
ncbi:hypothetical protein GCM10027610_004580 [Dactylosporangium cerinum]